jgi:hypothetical protein
VSLGSIWCVSGAGSGGARGCLYLSDNEPSRGYVSGTVVSCACVNEVKNATAFPSLCGSNLFSQNSTAPKRLITRVLKPRKAAAAAAAVAQFTAVFSRFAAEAAGVKGCHSGALSVQLQY